MGVGFAWSCHRLTKPGHGKSNQDGEQKSYRHRGWDYLGAPIALKISHDQRYSHEPDRAPDTHGAVLKSPAPDTCNCNRFDNRSIRGEDCGLNTDDQKDRPE